MFQFYFDLVIAGIRIVANVVFFACIALFCMMVIWMAIWKRGEGQ